MDPKDEIKEKIDIHELIAEYISLKPSGTNSFKGLCPFHGEKTPSFHVSTDRQIWHCFGCGEGGDCFSFLMRMEGMTFPEVLIHLGKKVGVEVKRFSTTEGNEKQRLLAMHELAEKFFHKVLHDSSGAERARAYLQARAIPEELLSLFGIGFAPDQWDTLCLFLQKRGYAEREIIQAGLGMKKKVGTGLIDRFRNRVMIPLRDHHGNTVGFTGRVLPGSNDQGPKYMNSPQTPIYNKSKLVFGLDIAKQLAKQAGAIVVTEGNLDVVASHKAGIGYVVASSGTALTQDQLTLLRRYTDTIIFAFDSDAAGFAAAKKGMSLARVLGFDIRAAILPDGVKDPDELVQQDPELWKATVSASVPIMEFLLNHVIRDLDLTQVDDKRQVGRELLPAIAEIEDVVEREHWLQKTADLLHVDVDVLRDSVVPRGQKSVVQKQSKTAKIEKTTKKEQVFELLFGYIMSREDAETFERSKKYLPSSELWITLYKIIQEEYDSSSHSAQKSLFSRIRDKVESHNDREALLTLLDRSTLLADQTFSDLPRAKVLIQLEHLFVTLERDREQLKRAELARKLRQAEAAGDKAAVAELLKQLGQT